MVYDSIIVMFPWIQETGLSGGVMLLEMAGNVWRMSVVSKYRKIVENIVFTGFLASF